MLVEQYDFEPPLSLEERLQKQLLISGPKLRPRKFSDDEDDDLPVVVDENEKFISFWMQFKILINIL